MAQNAFTSTKEIINFPQLPQGPDGPIHYKCGLSPEEYSKMAAEMENHLNKFQFLENSQISNSSMDLDDQENLPELTRLSAEGELTICKISKTGQIIEISDKYCDWWSNYTFLNQR